MTRASAGLRRQWVTFQNPSTPVADGDGGFTETWSDVGDVWVQITPASAQDLERAKAGTVLSTASHVIRGPWRSGVTTKTRMLFQGRTFSITGVANVDERSIDMELTAVEVVT